MNDDTAKTDNTSKTEDTLETDSEVLIVTSKNELLSFGYIYDNIGKEVVYEGQTYSLSKHGIRYIYPLMFLGYPSQNPAIKPRKPVWKTKLGELTLTISDIP